MSEKSRPELVLEAIKIFLWPVIIILAVLFLKDDVLEMLKGRTWKIGIVEVGDRIKTLENTVQGELLLQKDYLNKILNDSSDADKVKEHAQQALTSIKNAQSGVKKEIYTIKEAIPEGCSLSAETSVAKNDTPISARDWEFLGFSKLVERDIGQAIEAFTEAEKRWPDYHNVSEIRRVLVRDKDKLQDKKSLQWLSLYQTILEKYSWGMPANIRTQFLQAQKE